MNKKPSFLRVFRRALYELLSDKDALVFPITLIATVTGLIAVVIDSKKLSSQIEPRIMTFTLIAMGMTFAVFMLRFLTGKSSLSRDMEEELRRARYRHIRQLENELVHAPQKALAPEEHQQFVAQVTQRIQDSANETFLDELRQKLRESEFAFTITTRSEETLRRIYREIDSLTRRGTLNLVLGVVTAVSGIVLLSYVVLGEARPTATLTDFTTTFLPRLSIVTIIEVFAYFFLRLYKSSLNEIKYFQNEATNIEFHFTALLAALKHGSPELLKETIQAFLRTERNPLMSGDQRALTLEQEKLYATPTSLSVQQLGAIIESLSKANTKSA